MRRVYYHRHTYPLIFAYNYLNKFAHIQYLTGLNVLRFYSDVYVELTFHLKADYRE